MAQQDKHKSARIDTLAPNVYKINARENILDTENNQKLYYKSLSTDAQVGIVKAILFEEFSINQLTLQQMMELKDGIINGFSPMEVVSQQLVNLLAINLIQEQDNEPEYQYQIHFSMPEIQHMQEYIINNASEKDKGAEDIFGLLNLSNDDELLAEKYSIARKILDDRNNRFQELLLSMDPQPW